MAAVPFLGMRGTGDWPADSVPGNYREVILRNYPNGMTPLTAIMSMMKSEMTDNFTFYWATKDLPEYGGAVTSVYDDEGLGTEYTSGGDVGTTVYAKVAEVTAKQFRGGIVVMLTKSGDHRYNTIGEVTATKLNGANSYIAVKLDEAADGTYDLDEADRVQLAGSAHSQGQTAPNAISFDETWHNNYTQIFRAPLELTGTAMQTRLRTHDAFLEAKREALEQIALQMEWASLFGVKALQTGSNGKPKTKTNGVITQILANTTGHDFDYKNDSNYSGKKWIESGQEWLQSTVLRTLFRYGSNEKLWLCGDGIPDSLGRLAEAGADIKLEVGAKAYGLQVQTWIVPGGRVHIKTHPLFSQIAHFRDFGLICEPRHFVYRYMKNRDVHFKKGDMDLKNTTNNSRDGYLGEFLGEGGFEVHHYNFHGCTYNVGQDNAV